jgi:hypothetical protein
MNMTMLITDEWIKSNRPCQEALDWWDEIERDSTKILEKLITETHYEWANWLIVRVMTRLQYLKYAIFAAEQVLPIWEKYSQDRSPHRSIEAAKQVCENDTVENRAAAWAAWAAAGDAWAGWDAAGAAWDAWAAWDAAWAAWAAAGAAWAGWAGWDAAGAAWAAWDAAKTEMYKCVLNFGMTLLKENP